MDQQQIIELIKWRLLAIANERPDLSSLVNRVGEAMYFVLPSSGHMSQLITGLLNMIKQGAAPQAETEALATAEQSWMTRRQWAMSVTDSFLRRIAAVAGLKDIAIAKLLAVRPTKSIIEEVPTEAVEGEPEENSAVAYMRSLGVVPGTNMRGETGEYEL